MAIKRIIISLLLCAACHHRANPWELDRISSGTFQHSSSRLTYPASDKINGIDFELLQTHESLHAYLNIHSISLPTDHGSMTIEGISTPLTGHLRSGGQRLLLSQQSTEQILQALLSGHSVQIDLTGYRTTISPDGFASKFERMQHLTTYQNPFHHPF